MDAHHSCHPSTTRRVESHAHPGDHLPPFRPYAHPLAREGFLPFLAPPSLDAAVGSASLLAFANQLPCVHLLPRRDQSPGLGTHTKVRSPRSLSIPLACAILP